VARNFNSAASDLTVDDVLLPFFGANSRMGSVEKRSLKGKSYRQIPYEHVANVGKPGGPSWDDFDRCRALWRILTRSIKTTTAGVEEKTDPVAAEPPFWENMPESDAPPPTGDDQPPTFEDPDEIEFWGGR
jgi:hypothetical protein